MRKLILILVIVLSSPVLAVIFEDGGYHLINDNTYQDEYVNLDYNIVNVPGTHLELTDGGSIGWLYSYNNSIATINGGSIGELLAIDNSTVTFNGGSIGDGLWANGNSTVQVTGGLIGDALVSSDSSMIELSGGSIVGSIISSNNSTIIIEGGEIGYMLFANHTSEIYIYGSDFKINDIAVDYGMIDVGGGRLTGILSNGDAINNMFDINTTSSGPAAIFLVPEPTTLLLLGLGAITIRRRA